MKCFRHSWNIIPNLENDIGKLAEFSAHNRNVDFAGRIVYNEKDVEVFNFGKYKGKPVKDILQSDPGYYGWMMNGDFPLYTKKVLTSIKLNSINNSPMKIICIGRNYVAHARELNNDVPRSRYFF